MTHQESEVLAEGLRRRFGAEVEAEQVAAGRFRFTVVSPKFVDVPQLRRQDEAWEVVDAAITRELALDISLILTYSPDELEVESHHV